MQRKILTFLQSIFHNTSLRILGIIYLLSVIWWVSIALRGLVETTENYLFGIPFIVIPTFGGISALVRIKEISSQVLRRSVYFISFSFLLWGACSIAYLYYNLVLNIPSPFPSLADVGYFVALPIEYIGLIYLIIFLGLSKQMLKYLKRALFFLIPIGLCTAVYYVALITYFQSNLFHFSTTSQVVFFGLIPDVIVIITLVLVLYKIFSLKTSKSYAFIFIFILGSILYYLSDFFFYYSSTLGTFYIGGWIDLLYITALFIKVTGLHFVITRTKDLKFVHSLIP